MSSTKEYRNFILEQLNLIDNIVCKPMMGGYLLYCDNILFGGIYNDNFLIKIIDDNKKYGLLNQIPYKNAKPMYLVNELDNKMLLKEIILSTVKGLRNLG